MRFLADVGVSQQVVEWLRTNGHDAVHLRDEGQQRMPNGDIFQKAANEQRIVLTFDLDFGEILAGSGGQIVSVILFRLRNTRTDFVIQRLADVLNSSSAELSQGAIVIVEERPPSNQNSPDRKLGQTDADVGKRAAIRLALQWPKIRCEATAPRLGRGRRAGGPPGRRGFGPGKTPPAA